jgi:light-regulated signal transduction histidine kinase (bacteriophytochrome)
MKVVIVDKTSDNPKLLRALLESEDCRMVEAPDRLQALAELEAKVAELEQVKQKLETLNREQSHRVGELEMVEANLRKANWELECRLRLRTQELETSQRDLEAFLNSVSHDLRAPLRHINSYADMALQTDAAQLDEGNARNLHRIRESVLKIGDILDGLMELSRVSYSDFRQRQVDLSALALGVCEELRRSEADRAVRIEVASGLTVRGDPMLLRVALVNLLGNALKFTSKRADACIEFGRVKDDIARPYFVRDNGAGFDMAYVGKLFRAFQRLHSRTDFDGKGLGLATVQRIIHRHNGKTWAESAPDQGATFYFTLGENSPEVAALDLQMKQKAA